MIEIGGGAFYERFFAGDDYFQRISSEHAFQSLTESSKPSTAHRTGIYLSEVTARGDDLRFHLLRCSTNLSGPTENFCATDRAIVDALNAEADKLYPGHAPLNHVLAQIYRHVGTSKAKISSHADKTKDMPEHGIMAFCTFYDGRGKLDDKYEHKGKTGLTKLRFKPKAAGEEFTVTLAPNSVFFMPLSVNRNYTHEIQPSILDAELLPVRLGYVVRCSKTRAVHRGGQTYLERGDELVALEQPTFEGIAELRKLYAEENRTTAFIDYGDRFRFSMNEGDYRAPDRK